MKQILLLFTLLTATLSLNAQTIQDSIDSEICSNDSDKDGVKDSKDECKYSPRNIHVDEYGCSVTTKLRINFDSNSYFIHKELIPDIALFAEFLKENVGYHVIINGFTDSSGEELKNETLSLKRAERVKEILVKFGIHPRRLETIGMASKDPLYENDTQEHRAINRRIEIELLQ